ncbi:MAG TPA: PilZ domain-containing protein [Opitutaceae bacterium]|nr:PilZ domain-containing protein [Opitutaceae bacterium]
MDAVRILLVVAPGKSREAYLRRLDRLPAVWDVVDSIDSLETSLQDTPYNGLLLDVPTMIRASTSQKAKVLALLEYYPVLRLSYRAPVDEIHALADGQTTPQTHTLEEFVGDDCRRFRARAVRAFKRCHLVFNVRLLDQPEQPLEEGEKAFTVDVSESGCFVATVQPPESGRLLSVVLCDLADPTPIPIEVRWRILWGETMRTPGFGARFLSLTEEQKAELVAKLAAARSSLENE